MLVGAPVSQHFCTVHALAQVMFTAPAFFVKPPVQTADCGAGRADAVSVVAAAPALGRPQRRRPPPPGSPLPLLEPRDKTHGIASFGGLARSGAIVRSIAGS